VLIEFVIQFAMQVMNSMQMEILSSDDGGLWMDQCQDSDRWRTATLAMLQLQFG